MTAPTPSRMSEQQLCDAVVELAQLRRWRVHHDRPARTADGWRTAIQGDRGFPDLVLARKGVVIFAELKSQRGQLTSEQRGWLMELDRPGPELVHVCPELVYVWRPEDWLDGTIEEALR